MAFPRKQEGKCGLRGVRNMVGNKITEVGRGQITVLRVLVLFRLVISHWGGKWHYLNHL